MAEGFEAEITRNIAEINKYSESEDNSPVKINVLTNLCCPSNAPFESAMSNLRALCPRLVMEVNSITADTIKNFSPERKAKRAKGDAQVPIYINMYIISHFFELLVTQLQSPFSSGFSRLRISSRPTWHRGTYTCSTGSLNWIVNTSLTAAVNRELYNCLS